MELIDRYVYAVVKHLPQSQRKDVTKEVQGLIYDMLDARRNEVTGEDEAIVVVLEKLGDPRRLAEKYRDKQRFLIGPERFDSYLTILKIVFFAIGIASLTGFAIETLIEPTRLVENLVSSIVSFVTTSITGFGWVTIIFGLMEYKGVEVDGINMSDRHSWIPADLVPIPDPKRKIKRYEPVIAIIFNVFAMVMFLYFVEQIGAIVIIDGERTLIPFLNDVVFSKHAPFIYLILGVSILVEISKLIVGQWTVKLAWFTTLVNLVAFIIIFMMFKDQSIWNPYFIEQLSKANLFNSGNEDLSTIIYMWERSTMYVLLGVAIILVIESVSGFIKALK